MIPDPEDDSQFILESSGQRIYANNRVLGIGVDGDYVSEGYDGGVGTVSDFTDTERAEMADYAIACWVKFKRGL